MSAFVPLPNQCRTPCGTSPAAMSHQDCNNASLMLQQSGIYIQFRHNTAFEILELLLHQYATNTVSRTPSFLLQYLGVAARVLENGII